MGALFICANKRPQKTANKPLRKLNPQNMSEKFGRHHRVFPRVLVTPYADPFGYPMPKAKHLAPPTPFSYVHDNKAFSQHML
jgi:hypothetical protein